MHLSRRQSSLYLPVQTVQTVQTHRHANVRVVDFGARYSPRFPRLRVRRPRRRLPRLRLKM